MYYRKDIDSKSLHQLCFCGQSKTECYSTRVISFKKNQSLTEFQGLIYDVYGIPDDRQYSLLDLLVQVQRFSMRALKGIRKKDKKKIKANLLVAFSWLCAVANRLHIDLSTVVWHRFPYACSYCASLPCSCALHKVIRRKAQKRNRKTRPENLAALQRMFKEIYPPGRRSLSDAGVHLAEEMGEVSEAIHNYLGQHYERQIREVEAELADYVSCFFGVANSTDIDVASEFGAMYKKGCHVCHEAPCVCSFKSVSRIEVG